MKALFDAASSARGTGGTLTWSHTCTGQNLALVVGVANETVSPFTATVTYGGVALTPVVHEGVQPSVQQFYLLGAPAGTADVVVTPNAGAIEGYAVSAIGVGSIGHTAMATSPPVATNPTLTLASASSNFIVDVFSCETQGPLTSMQTLRGSFNAPHPSSSYCSTATGASSVVMGYVGVNIQYAYLAMELVAAPDPTGAGVRGLPFEEAKNLCVFPSVSKVIL